MTKASDLERAMLDLVNAERTARGMGELTLEIDLNEAAEDHSAWMLDRDVFSHTGVNGSSPSERVRDAGFDLSGGWGTAENIAIQSIRGAAGFEDDVADLHRSLMDSDGHRANILNPSYDHLGIGIEVGDFTYQGGWELQSIVVTQNFAHTGGEVRPDPPAPAPAPAPEPEPVPTPDPEPITDPEPAPPGGPTDGDDVLTGDAGANAIDGGAGHDAIDGAGGDDRLIGQGGRDTLDGGAGDDRLDGGWSDDLLRGGAGDDVLLAKRGQDVLEGGDGADRLEGGHGHDTLTGGAGDDTLTGGGHTDVLTGGAGADTFRFERAAGAPDADIVTDHTRREDRIGIEADLLGVAEGALDRSYAELGSVARQADTRLLYDPATGEVRIDVDGAGGQDAELLFTFDGGDRPVVGDVFLF